MPVQVRQMRIRIACDRHRHAARLANGGEDKLETVIIEPFVQGAEMRMQETTVKPEDGHCTVLKRVGERRFLSVTGADIE